jgi:hypothetical protein
MINPTRFLQIRIPIISITLSREEENTCRKLCREIEVHLSLCRENFHFWKVPHQQYKWYGLATWIMPLYRWRMLPVTSPASIIRAGEGRNGVFIHVFTDYSFCILLDWQASSFLNFYWRGNYRVHGLR